MKLSICTISFRHHLVSLDQLAPWAAHAGFHGIELWGVHAQNLATRPEYDGVWLDSHGLVAPMLSDYLPLQGDARAAIGKTELLCGLSRRWGAKKLRTFAGHKGSFAVTREERQDWTSRLRDLCVVAEAEGVSLLIETHPNTLADTLASTLRLVEEVDHPALRLNFDVIHVWEGGDDPESAFRILEPLVAHMHLKNVADPRNLSCFAPSNVYAPSGTREGMVRLFDGSFDYGRFLRHLAKDSGTWARLEASLEWFGPDVVSTLEADRKNLSAWEAQWVLERSPMTNAAARLA